MSRDMSLASRRSPVKGRVQESSWSFLGVAMRGTKSTNEEISDEGKRDAYGEGS